MNNMYVSEIYIYPIKSLKGIGLSESKVEERGLKYDRRYMVVDINNDLLTQREVSKMAIISTSLTENGLVVTNNDGDSLEILSEFTGAENVTVRVWNSFCEALVAEETVNKWFSENLEKKCRLVQMPDKTRRAINPIFNVNDDIVSFADGYPILLVGETSLDDLNSKLEKPIPVNRFRPNIVVSSSEAFAEDMWTKIRIGNTIFRATKPCARCVVTTIDQETGIFDVKEPLKALSNYRKAKQVYPGKFEGLGLNGNDVLFGINLVSENFGEEIKVNDKVEIIE